MREGAEGVTAQLTRCRTVPVLRHLSGVSRDPWFDLEPALKDFDIDIKDLQKVFSRDGSTCQNPLPPQPPLAGQSVGPL